jgi:eukaryotic-like serine/threonine-protein kinase
MVQVGEMVVIKGKDLCFSMGNNGGDDAEKPEHMVCLSPYNIDKFEVTNRDYGLCVAAGKCSLPQVLDKKSKEKCNYGIKNRSTHPVNCVDWNQAYTFCSWAKKRLPSEAEWEFAARGRDKKNLFPWGSTRADCTKAVIFIGKTGGCGKSGTWPTGSFKAGKSPYGLFDTIGNVWEWNQDLFLESYYKTIAASVIRDPKGPNGVGSSRVVRGGGWNSGAFHATFRIGMNEKTRLSHIGFRCAKSIGKTSGDSN